MIRVPKLGPLHAQCCLNTPDKKQANKAKQLSSAKKADR
jgi:hypothetical protein